MCKLYTKTQFVSDLRLNNSAGLEVQDAFFVRKVAREGGEKVRYEVSLADRSGAYFGDIRTLIPETSGQHVGIIRTAYREHPDTLSS